MPMTKEEKLEIVQRLRVAYNQTKKMLDREMVARELHAGTDIARYWPIITASYSGLEQTIKYLVAEKRGHGIQELIRQSIPANLRSGGQSKRVYPYRTHNITWLFGELEEQTQNVLREFYGRFQWELYS